jgi:hypothetical protein
MSYFIIQYFYNFRRTPPLLSFLGICQLLLRRLAPWNYLASVKKKKSNFSTNPKWMLPNFIWILLPVLFINFSIENYDFRHETKYKNPWYHTKFLNSNLSSKWVVKSPIAEFEPIINKPFHISLIVYNLNKEPILTQSKNNFFQRNHHLFPSAIAFNGYAFTENNICCLKF